MVGWIVGALLDGAAEGAADGLRVSCSDGDRVDEVNSAGRSLLSVGSAVLGAAVVGRAVTSTLRATPHCLTHTTSGLMSQSIGRDRVPASSQTKENVPERIWHQTPSHTVGAAVGGYERASPSAQDGRTVTGAGVG